MTSDFWTSQFISANDGLNDIVLSLQLNPFPSNNLISFIRYNVLPYFELNCSQSDFVWLDIGCADSTYLCYLSSSLLPITKFILSDINQSTLAVAKSNVSTAFPLAITESFYIQDNSYASLASETIDIVNAESSLYYQSYAQFCHSVKEVYRLLKPGGICRIYTKSERDRSITRNNKISEFTYAIDNPSHWEHGMIFSCPTRSSLYKLFEKFSDVTIGLEEYDYTGSSGLKSFYVITCIK